MRRKVIYSVRIVRRQLNDWVDLLATGVAIPKEQRATHQRKLEMSIVGTVKMLKRRADMLRDYVPDEDESLRFSASDCFEVNPGSCMCPCTSRKNHTYDHHTHATLDAHVEREKPIRSTPDEALECGKAGSIMPGSETSICDSETVWSTS